VLHPDASGVYRDLIAQAHNGSGKTTCFVLSMLSRWAGRHQAVNNNVVGCDWAC
jgi:superfamily II DNA/RNA helicase